ncbi:M90 family metallopeptidase [Nemorincola caseinilytica]
MIGVLLFIGIVVWFVYFYARQKRKVSEYKLPADAGAFLNDNVSFFSDLGDDGKQQFLNRVRGFLANTSVRGVGVDVSDEDRLLVAAGAIIPIFAFPDWRYNNIDEVLIYPGAFTRDFRKSGDGRDVAGMVGDGVMHRRMILSKQALWQSFRNELDGRNTVIHEFVHLIDKADGSVDGIPEYLLSHPYIIPWVGMIRDTIREMKGGDTGGIDMYGATSDAEFFAVIAEYFFERPDKLEANHPGLYALLLKMFVPPLKKR